MGSRDNLLDSAISLWQFLFPYPVAPVSKYQMEFGVSRDRKGISGKREFDRTQK